MTSQSFHGLLGVDAHTAWIHVGPETHRVEKYSFKHPAQTETTSATLKRWLPCAGASCARLVFSVVHLGMRCVRGIAMFTQSCRNEEVRQTPRLHPNSASREQLATRSHPATTCLNMCVSCFWSVLFVRCGHWGRATKSNIATVRLKRMPLALRIPRNPCALDLRPHRIVQDGRDLMHLGGLRQTLIARQMLVASHGAAWSCEAPEGSL